MKFRNIRLILILIIVLIIICAIYIIVKNNTNKQKNNYTVGKTIQYAKDIKLGITNYDTINPLLTNNKEIVNINKLIFEPLFTLNQEYKITPGLASEYAKIGEKTYVIKLNTNIKWSNDEPISAKDVIYTIEKLKNVNSPYSANVQNISNTEYLDENTIMLQLNVEEPFFEYNLIFPIISKNYYENEEYIASQKIPIGTGMLKISEINEKEIILEKNEKWRNPENEEIICEKIHILIYDSVGEVYNSFKTGKIDFMNVVNTNYENYIGTIGYYKKQYKGREVDFLSINCNDIILSDNSIRNVIAYAIDKEKIISNIYNNNYYISNYPIDYGTFICKDIKDTNCNLDKAMKILKDSGWINKSGKWTKDGRILKLNIMVDITNNKRCEVAELIKQQLEQLDISVEISKVSKEQYLKCMENKNYQILLTGVSNGFSPDINYFYGENNIANYNNEEVKNILKEVNNITDEKLLLEKYNKLIEITNNEKPYICLYRNKYCLLTKQNTGGQIKPNNYFLYYNFWSWHRQ